MKKPAFQRCLRLVPTLTRTRRYELKIVIELVDRKNVGEEISSLVGVPVCSCSPHCGYSLYQPWGNAHGLVRYRCQGFRRTFNALANTPLVGLHHKDRWFLYLEGFASGESVRKASRRCGINKKASRRCGINKKASFNWRHRFLHRKGCAG